MKLLTLLCFVMAFLPGCGAGGIVVHRPDGSVVEVSQPPKAVSPASISWGLTDGVGTQPGSVTRSESMTASTGSEAAPPSPTETAMGNLVYWAAALILVGAILVGLSFKFPFIPMDFGFILMGLGILGVMGVNVIQQHPLLSLICVSAALLTWFGIRTGFLKNNLHWFQTETSPEKQMELKMAGHHDAAGSLAYLNTLGDRLKAKAVSTSPPPA